jgi:hypothetical protein
LKEGGAVMAAVTFHYQVTRDSLRRIVPNGRLKKIARFSWEPDLKIGHPGFVCHRTSKYQREFEAYGGRRCLWPGAEEIARMYLESAIAGKDTEKNLGYCLHFIVDALCPEHIFPFREDINLFLREPHMSFMLLAALKYNGKIVRNSPIIQISSPEDLQRKIEDAADMIRGSFSCSYLREDGEFVKNPWGGKIFPWKNWAMPKSYLNEWVRISAGLIKGTLIYWMNAPKPQGVKT